jgi:hypothetical protein
LFYVDEDNWIHSLTAQGEEEHDGKSGPKLTYNDTDLKCNGKGVQSTTNEMAAISFKRSDGVLSVSALFKATHKLLTSI